MHPFLLLKQNSMIAPYTFSTRKQNKNFSIKSFSHGIFLTCRNLCRLYGAYIKHQAYIHDLKSVWFFNLVLQYDYNIVITGNLAFKMQHTYVHVYAFPLLCLNVASQ